MADTLQFKESARQAKKKTANNTGIPTPIKEDFEAAYRIPLDNVQLHLNSNAPAQFHAHAYAQYPHIYIAPGQEKHLPHELGHMIQQITHSVLATASVNGKKINDNPQLEAEADRIAARASSYSRVLRTVSAAHTALSSSKNIRTAPAGYAVTASAANAAQLMGERKAMKSVMYKPGKRRHIWRGNVIQDVVQTGGRSRKKLAELRDDLYYKLMNRLRKNRNIISTVKIYFDEDWSVIQSFASGELAKCAGAGNCGEFADATFSTLARLGHRQYIYTCSMRSTDPNHSYDHAFTMTSPFRISQILLNYELLNEQQLEKANIVDGWFNYRIMPLKHFLQGRNPYGDKLKQENIEIMTMVSPNQIFAVQALVPLIRREAENVYLLYHKPFTSLPKADAVRRYAGTRGMFGSYRPTDTGIPEILHDSRSGLARCMDKLKISTVEQFKEEFPKLPTSDQMRFFVDYRLPTWTLCLPEPDSVSGH